MNKSKEFLSAMRGLTSSVTVISSQTGDERRAMTASSVTSLSIDPPSMLVCVNKNASIYEILGKDKLFCINVLSTNQIDVANLCSSSQDGESRFTEGQWKSNNGIPYNHESSINIFCKCFDLFEHTSHSVFFGEVLEIFNNSSAVLLYGNGDYIKK